MKHVWIVCALIFGALLLRLPDARFAVAQTMPTSGPTPTPIPSITAFPSASPAPTGTLSFNETPVPADSLVNSIGVMSFFGVGYSASSAYCGPTVGSTGCSNQPTVQNLLIASGIRHFRDQAPPSGYAGHAQVPTSEGPLCAAGLTMNFLTTTKETQTQLEAAQTQLGASCIDQYENNNEPNDAGVPDWMAETLAFQYDLGAWKGTLNNASILGASVTGPYPYFPNIGFLDYGNNHGYQNSFNPETSGFGGITAYGIYGSTYYNVNYSSEYSSPKPVQMTEIGYGQMPTGQAYNQTILDDYAGVRYIPRVYLWNYFYGRVPRTYQGTFLDNDAQTDQVDGYAQFGMVRWVLNSGTGNFTYTVKPSYTATQNLISYLANPSATVSPVPLAYTISGNTANLYHALMQRSDGSYQLALWLGIPSWDYHCGNAGHNPCSSGDIVNPAQSVTLTTTPTFGTATLVSDTTGSGVYSAAPLSGWTGTSATFNVTDEIELVELRNLGPLTASPNPIVFAGPTSTPLTETYADPYATLAPTVSPTPAGIVSADVPAFSITNSGTKNAGGTVVLHPIAAGTASVVFNDGFNTLTVPVTIGTAPPTPVPTNTPLVVLAQPYSFTQTAGPYSTALPTPASGSFSLIAQVQCGYAGGATPNPAGNDLASLNGGAAVGLGLCTAPTPNPATAAGAHIYVNSSGAQANAPAALAANTQYIVAIINNVTTGALTYYTCTYPSITCTAGTSAAATNFSTAGTTLIGDSTDGSRRAVADIWNVGWFNGIVLTAAGTPVTTAALLTTYLSALPSPAACPATKTVFVCSDPYPGATATPTPTPTPTMAPTTPPPSGTPTPLIVISQPYSSSATAGPMATTLPTPATFTFITQLKCGKTGAGGASVPNPAGNDLLLLSGAVDISAGLCNAPAANPVDGSGAHAYLYTGTQANAPSSLTDGAQYIAAITNDVASGLLTYYTCTYPSISCTAGTSVAAAAQTYSGTSYIGAANTTTRIFVGDIWNTRIYGSDVATTAGAMTTFVTALATADPYPSPTATATATAPPPGTLVDSALFTGNTPFHHTIAKLVAAGATEVAGEGAAFAGESLGANGPASGIPLWIGAAGDQTYTWQCNALYGSGCLANGLNVHVPAGATNQCQTFSGACNFDYHLTVIDPILNGGEEADGGSANSPPYCAIGGGVVGCLDGGGFVLNGSGLTYDTNGNNLAVAGGYAPGLFELTAKDLSNAAIYHGLGVVVQCASTNNQGGGLESVYPAHAFQGGCGIGSMPANAPVYGHVEVIKPGVALSSIPGGSTCQKVYAAIQNYGIYPMDIGGGNTNIATENYLSGTSTGRPIALGGTNLWTQVEATANSQGDGSGSGATWVMNCLGRIPSGDWDSYQLNQGGDSALPPYYGYGDPRN
jgi:hypothetical protein